MQPRFATEFSVWEKEVQEFIQNVSSQSAISKNDLTEWFYGEGANAFVNAQKVAHGKAAAVKRAQGITSLGTTTEDIAQNKIAGFDALLPLIIAKFANDNVSLQASVNQHFKTLKDKAVADDRLSFFAIQAQITNDVTKFIMASPDPKEAASTAPAKVKELFLAMRAQINKDLTQAQLTLTINFQPVVLLINPQQIVAQIDAQLRFSDEWLKSQTTQQTAVLAKAPLSPRAALSLHQPAPVPVTADDKPSVVVTIKPAM